MTRRVRVTDRLVVGLVGLALVALGLLGLDWRYGWLLDRPDTLYTGQATDVVESSWWPWAAAGGGLVLGLLGLWWLLAHLRRPGPGTRRLEGSDATGLVEADLRSVATASADRLAGLAPVVGAKGHTEVIGGRTVVVLTGQVDPHADPDSLLAAATTCADELAEAFPAERLTCRVVLDAPRRSRTGRSTRVRVR